MRDEEYLANMNNIFRGEQIKMAPLPSVMRAQEDEDVYIQPTAQAPMAAPRPMPRPDRPNEIAVTDVQPVQGTQEPYVPATIAQKISMGLPQDAILSDSIPAPTEPILPPELTAPGTLVPPETNVTLEEFEGVPPLETGVPNPERRGGSYKGDATGENNTDAHQAARQRFHDNRIRNGAEGEPNMENGVQNREGREEFHRNRVRARLDMYDTGNLPNPENETEQTAEEAAALEEAVAGIPDNMGTNGEQHPPMVNNPDGTQQPVTKADVQRVAAEDPKGFSRAMGWIQKTFGISGQDLARFALMYVGSRIAGYKHGESMSWAFQVASQDLLSRRDVTAKMADSGKYTPESIEKYRNTGDVSVLEEVENPEKNGVKIDYTRPMYKTGTNEIVHPATLADGTKVYIDSNGKPYTGGTQDLSQAGTDMEDRGDRVKRNMSIIDDHLSRMDDEYPWYTGSKTADAEVVQDRLDHWARQAGVSLDKSATAMVIGNAVRQAERWAKATGGQVQDLGPFIDAQMMYMDPENKWANQLHKGGKQLQPDDILKLNESILNFAMSDPNFDPAKVERGAMLNEFMKYAWEEYQLLPADRRNELEKKDGFYSFLLMEFNTTR